VEVKVKVEDAPRQTDRLPRLLQEQREAQVIAAYEAYRAGKGRTILQEITRFATNKVYWVDVQFPETVKDVDDIAQDVTLAVWQALESGTFRGKTGREFLSFLKTVCYNHKCDHFGKSLDNKQNKVSFFVELEDEDGNATTRDNKELYPEPEGVGGYFRIPEWVDGDNRYICKLIMDGKTYEQIGEYLGISGNAVKLRVAKIREQAQKKEKKDWGRDTF
jgi:DNA-directed RNA polymerase specialized sigma24 family protein